MIDPADRGFTLGDGLFETLRVEDGRIADPAEHLARLEAGCDALGLPRPERAWIEAEADRAVAGARGRSALRLTWSAGPGGRGLDRPADPSPRLVISLAPAPEPAGPASLVVASVRRNQHSPASRHKTLSYLDNVLARREAAANGADEALMLNTAGEVACAAAANVFWERDGVLFTPALECGVLAGVTRAQVMREAASAGLEVKEVRAPLQAMEGAAIFLTSSLIGLRPVDRLGGQPQVAHSIVLERLGRK